MAYGLIYISEFTSIAEENYLVEIYKKDYTGIHYNITAAGAPVLHKWATDEPKAAVKGSSLTINLVNENGNLPLSAFYSTESNTFLVKFYHNTDLKFTGYLVQEDHSEPVIDYSHEIQLSATDNLGLLKDVSLLDAARLWGERTGISTYINRVSNYILSVTEGPGTFPVAAGDSITVLITDPDGVPYNGTYLVEAIAVIGGVVTEMQVTEFIPLPLGFGLGFTGSITLIKPVDITERLPLTTFLRLCLLSTSLELNTHVYANIIENDVTLPRFLEETYLSGNYFLNSNNWQDCYQVLEIILGRFNCTLFQADGVWNIVRWDELRYYDGLMPGFRYNSDMEYFLAYVFASTQSAAVSATAPDQIEIISAVTIPVAGQQMIISNSLTVLDGTYIITAVDNVTNPGSPILTVTPGVTTVASPGDATIDLYDESPLVLGSPFAVGLAENGAETYAETGLLQQIISPYKYDKETFNYKQPANLLRNQNFTILGDKISETIVGSETWKEYEMVDWFNYDISPGPYPERFIRIVYDTATSTEITRYGVVRGTTWDSQHSAQSCDIEITENDVIKLSFSFKTYDSYPGPGNVYFGARVKNGVDTYQIDTATTNGEWLNTGSIRHTWTSTDNLNVWQNVEVTSKPCPISGIFNFFLAETVLIPANETWYKNITFEIQYNINDTTKIIGHTHTDTQTPVIKNKEDIEIFIDDSPRNTINGTMFLSSFTGLLQDRTQYWQRGANVESLRLGEITTFEQLFWRKQARTKLEGALHGLIQDSVHLSLLTALTFSYFQNKNFIWGMLEIDYRNSKASGTIWEMYEDGEEDSDLREYYEFKYLYETK